MKVILKVELLLNVPADRRAEVRAAVDGAIAALGERFTAVGAEVVAKSQDFGEAYRDELLRLAPRKVHLQLGQDIAPARYRGHPSPNTKCGNWASRSKMTTDPAAVTCQLCRKRIEQDARVSDPRDDCLDCYHPFAEHNQDGTCRTCKKIEREDPLGDRLEPPHQHRCLPPADKREPARRGKVHIVRRDGA